METIVEYLPYVVVAVSAYWVGWHVRAISILTNLAKNPDHFIKLLEQIKEINDEELADQDKSGTELFIERVGNTLYAYAKDTNQFVAQAPDLKTLLEEAHKRYPNKTFFGTISKDNPAKELA